MKHLFWLCSFLLLIGCTENEIIENNVANNKKFYATIEGTDSRTYVDEKIRLRWTAEDCITIFDKTTYNREFMFTGKTGANAGGFTQKSVDDKFRYEVAVDNIYAVYPHSSDIQLDETDLFLTLDMPADQTYVENSFGLERIQWLPFQKQVNCTSRMLAASYASFYMEKMLQLNQSLKHQKEKKPLLVKR